MTRRRSKKRQTTVEKSASVSNETGSRLVGRPVLFALGAIIIGVVAGAIWWQQKVDIEPAPIAVAFEMPDAKFSDFDETKLKTLCSHCHQCPEPDVLPRDKWKDTIWQMYEQAGYGRTVQWPIAPEEVVAWFEARAPEKLSYPAPTAGQSLPIDELFDKHIIRSSVGKNPFAADIDITDMDKDGSPELLVCDMRNRAILMGSLKSPNVELQAIAKIAHPARLIVTDLDGDERRDLIVANLGSFFALDHNLGSVEWFRQTEGGQFQQVTLADQLGRVADVQTDDVDGDGDTDLLVAEFGWKSTGHVWVLENETSDNGTVKFKQHAVDGLAGANQVAGVDINNDGKRDILALYSQGRELVRCYIQRGKFQYEIVDLYKAPHPAWGFTAFELVDLDQDDDLDILLSNGDTFDDGFIKPDHGIRWLENTGDFTFVSRTLATMYGAFCAKTIDIDTDGDLDVVACSLLANGQLPAGLSSKAITSILLLEQTAPGQFRPQTLETKANSHPTLTVADVDADGTSELLIGRGVLQDATTVESDACVELWKIKRPNNN